MGGWTLQRRLPSRHPPLRGQGGLFPISDLPVHDSDPGVHDADLGVHDPDLSVHDGAIWVFTMAEIRTLETVAPARSAAADLEDM